MYRRPTDHLRQGGAAVAQDPGITVLIGTHRTGNPQLPEHLSKGFHRMGDVGVFQVMGYMLDHGVGLCMFGFQPWDKQAALPFGVHHKSDRSLGRNEGETGVI